jgi:AAA domain
MALRIIKATEPMPVENIVLTVYAAPGLGKSTLGFTAEKPLMLDFDKGAYRSGNRGDAVTVAKWSDVEAMTAEDLEPYKTIIVDTAGRALDAMGVDIILKNPKAGRGGNLTLQGYGELKGRFTQWQSFLRSQGKDLVLICHMSEEKNGDDTMERIDAQGSSKNEIYKSSDAMCRIQIQPDGSRVLNFDPREGGFGKNPAQLPRLVFPHPDKNPHFLADVISQIKGSINKMTESQAEVQKENEAWQAAVDGLQTVEEVNALVKIATERKLAAPQKGLLSARATALGLTFDTKSKLYVAPEEVTA